MGSLTTGESGDEVDSTELELSKWEDVELVLDGPCSHFETSSTSHSKSGWLGVIGPGGFDSLGS